MSCNTLDEYRVIFYAVPISMPQCLLRLYACAEVPGVFLFIMYLLGGHAVL